MKAEGVNDETIPCCCRIFAVGYVFGGVRRRRRGGYGRARFANRTARRGNQPPAYGYYRPGTDGYGRARDRTDGYGRERTDRRTRR